MLSKGKPQSAQQLKPVALIALICIISAVPPVATDLFLPALPSMPAYFGESEATLNLVLVAFFICMAAGMLVLGPISDKHGIFFGSYAFGFGSLPHPYHRPWRMYYRQFAHCAGWLLFLMKSKIPIKGLK